MQGLPQIGEVLDATYRIESELGRGGFGAVYLARQISMDRDVALKVLVANAMKVDEMIQRFRREVMAVRNLGHPNTIRIYDFRDRADGMLYYAMEYVKGPTLKDVIKEAGPMPPSRVHHIIRQVLKSLAEAHSYGIIHRDLKPANIMLAEMYGEKDFVKVLDFGIAKILDGEEEEKEAITSAGVLVGTLNYMSPEQIAGGEISAGSDLYALALIAVEMLTGKSVFAGTGRWEILHKQISDEPVEVPEVVLQSPLGPIIRKALNKRQHERFPSAEKMLSEMDKVTGLDGGPLITLDEVEVEAVEPAPAASKPVSHSGPISNSTPISHSGPITNSAAVRDSQPPGEAVALSPGSGRTEGSAQIRVGAPGFSDDQTGQVSTTPDFLPQRDPIHTPVPSPTPPGRQPQLEESEKPTIAPGPGALAALTGAPADPKPVQQTRVNTHQTGRQNFGAEPGAAVAPAMEQGGGNKGLIIGVIVLAFVALSAGAAVMVLGGGDEPQPPPPEQAVVTPPVEPPQEEEIGDLLVERPSEPAPGSVANVETKEILVTTGGVRAQLFDGEKLIGGTPLRLQVGEEKVYTIKADGYDQGVVTLSNKSDGEVAVELKKQPGAEKPTNKPKDTKPADTKPADTKPADTKPADTKPKDTTKPKDKKPGLDWVPIGSSKKDDKKGEKKDEKKIPVF